MSRSLRWLGQSPAIQPSARDASRWPFLLFIAVLAGACSGGGGGCGGCGSTQPLPAGGLPVDQTVEGGGQIRVTPSGMGKIQTLARDMVDDALGEGFCVPPTELGDATGTFGTGAFLCRGNQNQCTPGCDTDIHIDSITVSAPSSQVLRLRAQVDATAQVPTQFQIVGIGDSCTLSVTANNVVVTADITLGVNGGTGELSISDPVVPRPSLSVSFGNCGLGSVLLNLFSGFFTGFIADAVVATVQPTLRDLIRDLLPEPLGISGTMDVAALLSGLTSGASGKLEARVLPGGYVHFTTNDGGLSLGVITGFNADANPATRLPADDSEAARCVPPMPPLDFTKAPHALPRNQQRQTFTLPTAAAFNGMPNPTNADLAIGLSETTFDLLGHHLVTSGAACLGVGTAQVPQLTLATFAIVSSSLANLGTEDRKDPMLLVTRPTKAVDFAIGDGTEASPSLTMKIEDFDVDVYAFVYERYIRAFTMTLALDVGINLELEQTPGQGVTIKPVLLGVSSRNVRVAVQNLELLRESKQDLETVLPVIFDLVTPLLGDLPSFALPAFAGFSLQDLRIEKVSTTEDKFLAVIGNLGTVTLPASALAPLSMQAAQGAAQPSRLAKVAQRSGLFAAAAAPAHSTGKARLADVKVPPLAEVRQAVAGTGGALPEVTFEVDSTDELGRALEWSWRLNDGMWRPYTSAAPLVIRDRAFAFQGDFAIGLMSRVKGDYRTASSETRVVVRIDSVAPHLVKDGTRWQRDGLRAEGFDDVAGRSISIAFGSPGDDAPATGWIDGEVAELSAAEAQALARDTGAGEEIVVFLRDPSGNVSAQLVAPFHGTPGEAGCNCDASGGPSSGGLLMMVLAGGLLLLARRSRSAGGLRARLLRHAPALRRGASTLGVFLAISVTASMVPGCNCSNAASKACEVVQDCSGFCAEAEVPFCVDGSCICAEDIPPGKIGPYADIAVNADGTAWVAAYAQSHGDLVAVKASPGRVAAETWEWVDGVPDGPIVVENAKIRSGIADEGPDVGMYPSVAVTTKGEPVISYFDRETASLRFAARAAGVWKNHVVDAGTGSITGAAGKLVGMYTAMSLRSDDGRPGIAYLAHVKDENGVRAEVRYASAQTAEPQVAGDWIVKVVDTAPVPVATPDDPNIFPLPAGLGLFVDTARLVNQAPVIVYYDRTSGALKMATFNPTFDRFDVVTLDGGAGNDAGWSPSIAVDAVGKVHVAYVGAARDDLEYLKVSTPQLPPEIVDDGYRIVGETPEGLPKPEFHFVGDDASLVVSLSGVPVVTYQDATSHELLIARRGATGAWTRTSVAGGEDKFDGAYGFFAAAAATASTLHIVSWVLDPSVEEQWVEIFERPLVE